MKKYSKVDWSELFLIVLGIIISFAIFKNFNK